MSIDRGLDKEPVVHIYKQLLFSHKKKNEMMSFAVVWMDLETIILSERQWKDKHLMISLICAI